MDISARMGLGAILLHAALLDSYFAEYDKPPQIEATGSLYTASQDDIFTSLIPLRRPDSRPGHRISYRFSQDISLNLSASVPTFQAMRERFISLFDLEIRYGQSAHHFINQMGQPFVAVHYRGSDKALEADPVTPGLAITKLREAARMAGTDCIFVASDEISFIDQVRNEFHNTHWLRDQLFASGDRPAHFSGAEPQLLARDALVNLLVMSHAVHLVRTSSNLSLAAALTASPGTLVTTLNHSRSDLSGQIENQLADAGTIST